MIVAVVFAVGERGIRGESVSEACCLSCGLIGVRWDSAGPWVAGLVAVIWSKLRAWHCAFEARWWQLAINADLKKALLSCLLPERAGNSPRIEVPEHQVTGAMPE